MKQLYELHLTFDQKPQELPGWHYSYIMHDPELGQGPKHYLTGYAEDIITAIDDLEFAANLRPEGLIRKKIELIIFDERA